MARAGSSHRPQNWESLAPRQARASEWTTTTGLALVSHRLSCSLSWCSFGGFKNTRYQVYIFERCVRTHSGIILEKNDNTRLFVVVSVIRDGPERRTCSILPAVLPVVYKDYRRTAAAAAAAAAASSKTNSSSKIIVSRVESPKLLLIPRYCCKCCLRHCAAGV